MRLRFRWIVRKGMNSSRQKFLRDGFVYCKISKPKILFEIIWRFRLQCWLRLKLKFRKSTKGIQKVNCSFHYMSSPTLVTIFPAHSLWERIYCENNWKFTTKNGNKMHSEKKFILLCRKRIEARKQQKINTFYMHGLVEL